MNALVVQRPLALLAIVLILAASLMGFFHTLIPHTEHGALHDSLWAGLGGSLSRHDLTPGTVDALPILFGIFLLALLLAPLVSPRGIVPAPLLSQLRRGVVQYRKFR